MDDSRKALKAFLDIISFDRIISILVLCIMAWLLLVLLQFCLKQLNKAFIRLVALSNRTKI